MKEEKNYITLQQFLKKEGIVDTGGMCKFFIEENEIFLNEKLVKERGKKLYINDVLKINGKEYIIDEC